MAVGNDPLPADGAEWNLPFDTATDDYTGATRSDAANNGAANDILGRTLQRTVPSFDAT